MVLAHPDDESMGNGTLVTRHVAAGCEVHLVCATRGGAGWTGRPAGRDPSELPEIREGELARAAEVLGLAGVELWDYPDGGVARQDQAEIVRRIQEAVEKLQPDAVVGWGPDGGYGHADHIAVGACTDKALAGTGRAHYHMAVDRQAADAYDRLTRRHAVDVGDMHLAGVPRVDVVLEPSKAELDTVRRAIECHYSQRNKLVDLLLSDDHMLFWMARSCYVRRDGTLNPPATDMLPELSSPRLRGEVGGGPA